MVFEKMYYYYANHVIVIWIDHVSGQMHRLDKCVSMTLWFIIPTIALECEYLTTR